MKKLVLIFALLAAGSAAAQQDISLNNGHYRDFGKPVEISLKPINYDFVLTATKNKQGPLTVNVIFEGGTFQNRSVLLRNKTTEIARWPAKQGWQRFSFTYFPGELNPDVQEDFVYRLPFAPGTTVKVGIDKGQSSKEGRNVRAFRRYLLTAPEVVDVYVIRKGEVERVTKDEKGKLNIFIDQADGTKAIYQNVEPDHYSLRPGDIVYPDTPIGKAETLELNVVYYTAPVERGVPAFGDALHSIGIDPVFLTQNGEEKLSDGAECMRPW